MHQKSSGLAQYIRIAQPFLLAGSLLSYSIGLGIVHYLNQNINWASAAMGALLVLLVLLTRNFLSGYFTFPEEIPAPSLMHEIKGDEPDTIKLEELQRNILFEISLVALATVAGIIFVLIYQKTINATELLTIGLAILFAFLSSVPPIRLERHGYGELIEAILICNLFPFIAFLIQEPAVHPLLGMLTFPLTFVFLGMKIATSLEYYSFDLKHVRGSLVVLMGWQHAMSWHNFSIFLAFILLGVLILLRLPWLITWPIFLALPLGIFQILQIQQISDGAKPHWWMLRLNSVGTFTVMAYLTSLTLWIH